MINGEEEVEYFDLFKNKYTVGSVEIQEHRVLMNLNSKENKCVVRFESVVGAVQWRDGLI